MTDAVQRLSAALADRYVIERELGAGGMATVYLAQDVRHARRVALKVLRPELSAILGAERFVHEIKTTANLQHPHILSLFDSGEADGLVYYVMPYVEGESLRDRLTRERQLPVDDAVRIAREVADALQYAHQQGIVHRDIKPENILLHGGHAMVADFGIALAAAKVEGGTRMTETGMSLGTPHYMSPEQAMGEREITPKADIYALGCVLYEMLTAEPPFVGATAQAIIARVMTEEPRSLTMQRKTIPPHVEAAVEKALEKLPADRFASAAEFGAALSDTGDRIPGHRGTATRRQPAVMPSGRLAVVPWAIAALALAAAAGGWLRPQHHVAPPPIARFGIRMSPEVVTTVQGQAIAMSPDGSRIVYVASSNNGQELYTRLLSQSSPVPIPGTANAVSPFFSADGRYVAFVNGSKLLKAAVGGGPVLPVTDVGPSFRGGSWNERDTILYADDSGLHLVAASGGAPTLLAAPDSGSIESYRWPEFLPGGSTAIFSIGSGAVDRLAVIALGSRAIRRLDIAGANPHYVRQGFVAMAVITDGTTGVGSGSLIMVPFDARRAVATGAPIPVAESVQVGVNSRTAKLGMSRDGAIVFASGSVGLGTLALVSRSGAVRNLGDDTHFFSGPRLSPDGRRIAAQIVDTGNDIWVFDIVSKTLTRLTFDRTAIRPIWSPDGRRIVYTRRGPVDDDLAWIPADGSGPAQALIAAPENQVPGAFTPDGRMMVLREQGVGKRRLSYLTFDSTPAIHPLLANQAENYSPTLSPDGRWMAYNSDESGRTEIYVRPFPGPGGRWQISRDGGGEPRWSPTGREIFYRHGPSMMAAAVQAGTAFAPGEIKELFRMNGPQGVTYTNYDVTRDGQNFVMVVPAQNNDQAVVVLLNWFENLPREVPVTDAAKRLSVALQDRYVIERELGAGGMATVYLAHDVRHDRRVALKVLRPELSAILGGERFLAEIKTTANLQHPHILSLFDSGEADGLVYYVMPYVEGESLRDRLNREKQLPVEDAVRIAREVADALEYAHQHGIVHRDIKPENILLHGGHAQVADFGIALAASRSDGGSRMTETGMSLGTPHYMSPEQAMGEREITPKADIYALGCVLYEMLTAEPPFVGATAQAIIARVMTEEPRSLTMQRRTIPPHVEAAVRTALEKLPADRWASAAQFGAALADTGYRIPETGARTKATALPPYRRTALIPWLLAAAGIATSAWLATHRARVVPPPAERFTLSFGRGAAASDATGSPIAISPDGSRIVYVGTDSVGTRQLFQRGLDQVDPASIPGTVDAHQPFFSPDGQWLGFAQDGKLRKVALAGGAVVTICDAASPFYGASWGDGDVIVFSQGARLKRVPAAGGQPTDVVRPDSGKIDAYRFPEVLPGARAALFTAVTDSGPSLRVVNLSDGRVTPLGQRGVSPHYVDGGFLVYAELDGTLFAAPFDASKLKLTGAPQPVTDNVRLGPAQIAKLGIARTGSLAYLSGAATQTELALVGLDGRVTPLPATPARYAFPRFSPDGRRIAVTVQAVGRSSVGVTTGDVWVWDIAARNFQRITFDTASSAAEWLPDGRRLAYDRAAGTSVSLFTILTDGSGRPESLLARPVSVYEVSVTPDGRRMVFRETNAQTGRDILMAPLDSPQAVRPLLVTPFDERNPAVSPDGHWLAYASNETGAHEIYVRNLAEGSGRTRVSLGGGAEPRWAPNGRTLYFRTGDSVFAAAVTPGAEFRAATPRSVFAIRRGPQTQTNWDVSPDGRHFVVVYTPDSALEGSPVHVILHWFDQLRAKQN